MTMEKLRLGSDKVIEEIKERLNMPKLEIENWCDDYERDISFLLSIIEQAEKALERISDLHIRGIEDRAAEPHRAIAEDALQAIRK